MKKVLAGVVVFTVVLPFFATGGFCGKYKYTGRAVANGGSISGVVQYTGPLKDISIPLMKEKTENSAPGILTRRTGSASTTKSPARRGFCKMPWSLSKILNQARNGEPDRPKPAAGRQGSHTFSSEIARLSPK